MTTATITTIVLFLVAAAGIALGIALFKRRRIRQDALIPWIGSRNSAAHRCRSSSMYTR